MAKFYGLAGTRRGSVGNETYYIHKTQNIVKKKATYVFNPRTRKQQIQRMKMKNTLNGLRNVKNALELNTYTNQQVIESEENAYVKNNVALCSMIDRVTSNIPNFPTISSNIICSYGTLDSLPITYDEEESTYIGILIEGEFVENPTIQKVSADLLNNYEYIRNRDAVTFFYYYCTNIMSSDERLFEWENENIENNAIEMITGRRTFIISTTDNRALSTVGMKIMPAETEDFYVLFPNVKTYADTYISEVDDKHPCYMSLFYSREIAENTYNFCTSVSGFNAGYQDMQNYTKREDYQEFCLESWKTNIAE